MYEITEYVKDIIKGNWPEFEKKIKDDVFNSVYYYIQTGVDPIYITNPTIRDIVLFNKAIENKNPILKSTEFEQLLKNFIFRSKKELKHGTWNQIVNFVIKPYMEYSGKDLRKIIKRKD